MAILDIFGKKKAGETPAEETTAAETPVEEGTPDISVSKGGQEGAAPRRTLTGPQAENMKKIEAAIKALHDGKRDCYLILDPRTTLEEFETHKNIRPAVTALNPQSRVPVLHIATSELVADQVARDMKCVVEDKALAVKVPFPAVFKMMNDLAMAGIFGFVIHEVGKHYAASTIHAGGYLLGELEKQDIRPYMDQMLTLQSLHQMRTIKGRYYVATAPGTTMEQAKAGNFSLATGFRAGRPFAAVFATKALAEGYMNRVENKSIIVEMNAQQLVDKLAELRNRLDQEYVVLYCEPRGAHPQIATMFIATCCQIMKLQVPKLNALKAKEEPSIVTMDGAEESEEASAVEEMFVEETAAEEITVEDAPAEAEEKTEE